MKQWTICPYNNKVITMQLKKLLGTQAYWTINKELANEYGLHATLLLQHLIDLRESFFTKGTPFYQQQSRLAKDLPMSEYQIRQATKVLVDADFISVQRVGVPPKYEYSIKDLNLYRFFNLTFIDEETKPLKVKNLNHKHKELTNTNNQPNTNIDDVYGKIFFRIVDAYPANRIGNRQHGLKKFKKLDIEEAKLAAVNLKRYLTVAGDYTKSLQNYIDQKCFSEAWLKAEEETKRKKLDKTNTKTFNKNYDEFI